MRLTTVLAIILGASAPLVSGFKNNCKGSSRRLTPGNCLFALNEIPTERIFNVTTEFSQFKCFIQYTIPPTWSNVPMPLSGAVIKRVAQDIINECPKHKGSFATGQDACSECYVTVNFRVELCNIDDGPRENPGTGR